MSENNKSRLARLQPPWVASHDAAHRAGGGVAMVAIVHDDDSGNIATVDLARAADRQVAVRGARSMRGR